MTIDDVMKAAQHMADAQEGWNSDSNAMAALRSTVQAAIDLAVDAERERCAKIADGYDGGRQNMADIIADAIRGITQN